MELAGLNIGLKSRHCIVTYWITPNFVLVANIFVRSTTDGVHLHIVVFGRELVSHTNVLGLEVSASPVLVGETK